ncbi:hypothetical protein TYRP_017444 [Tyrophagus putrescentiae]|nr:hypothetical protein TYRP_017444 [Tyrophagus putrescentiae]
MYKQTKLYSYSASSQLNSGEQDRFLLRGRLLPSKGHSRVKAHRRHLLHRQLVSTFLKGVLSSSFPAYFVIASSAEASLGQIVAQLGGQLAAGALVLAAEDEDEESGEDEGDGKDEKDQDQVSFRLYCCTTQAEVEEVVVFFSYTAPNQQLDLHSSPFYVPINQLLLVQNV